MGPSKGSGDPCICDHLWDPKNVEEISCHAATVIYDGGKDSGGFRVKGSRLNWIDHSQPCPNRNVKAVIVKLITPGFVVIVLYYVYNVH